MTVVPRVLPTKEFSDFLPSHRAVREFEKLFEFVNKNFGTFFDTTDQAASTIETATPVTFDSSQDVNGMEIDSVNTSRINVTKAGTYKFNYTFQLRR